MAAKWKANENFIMIGVRIPRSMKQAIDQVALENDIPLSTAVIDALAAYWHIPKPNLRKLFVNEGKRGGGVRKTRKAPKQDAQDSE